MTERTIDQQAAIRLVEKFREMAPLGVFDYLLSMRGLQLGVKLGFPSVMGPFPPDGLVQSERNIFLGASRAQINSWAPEVRADVERVMGLLKEIYPDLGAS